MKAQIADLVHHTGHTGPGGAGGFVKGDGLAAQSMSKAGVQPVWRRRALSAEMVVGGNSRIFNYQFVS